MTFIYLHYSNYISRLAQFGHQVAMATDGRICLIIWVSELPMAAALTEGHENHQENSPDLLFQENPVQAVRC